MGPPSPPRPSDAERFTWRWIRRALPSSASLATTALSRVEGRPPGHGTTPATFVVDERGRQLMFRAMDEREIAAEELAMQVRALGRRPHLPVARRTVELHEGDSRAGLVRPYVPEASPLPSDPTEWSPLDRAVLLREHPWEWLLANLDTHAGQYLRVGPFGVPVNIDWDRTLADLHVTRLDRFTRRGSVLVPAINRVYDLYVTGRISLRFAGLWGQVGRASTLPPTTVAECVRAYADAVGDADREGLVETVLARQEALPAVFGGLVSKLRDERWRWRRTRGDGPVSAEVMLAHARDRLTRLALTEPPPALTRQLLGAWSLFRRLRRPGARLTQL